MKAGIGTGIWSSIFCFSPHSTSQVSGDCRMYDVCFWHFLSVCQVQCLITLFLRQDLKTFLCLHGRVAICSGRLVPPLGTKG